ncbi:hypothetical protein RYA05_03570 [Pseudomonas syringae pv. actinidiae]|nr:hypothetical protein [Pseudomonas syringae pv. actinidiae]
MGWKKAKRKPHMIGILVSRSLGPVGALSYRVDKDAAGDLHVSRRGVLNFNSVEGEMLAPDSAFIPGNMPSLEVDFLANTTGKMIDIKVFSQRFREQSPESGFDVLVHDIDRIFFIYEIEVDPDDTDDFSSTEQRLAVIDAINANLLNMESLK